MFMTRFAAMERDPIFGTSLLGPAFGMRGIQQELNRLFDGAFSESGSSFPLVDVFANDNEAIVRAELPDVTAEQVDLSVVGNTLTMKGERKVDPEKSAALEKGRYLRREREFGTFSRTIELPFPVESEAVSAEYRNGVLRVTLPRAAADKPKKISIR